MSRETAKSGPRRSSTTPCRASAGFISLAILVLFAHPLVVAHTFSHLSDSPVEGTSRHCAICSFGGHSAGVPAAMLTVSWQTVTWIAGFSSSQLPPTRLLNAATFARAPPLAPLIVTIV